MMKTTVTPCLYDPLPPRLAAASSRRRGVAMVMVMIALTVGTIITLSFLSSQTTSTAIAHNATRQVQARAIAEDGMRLVIEHLRATPDWRDDHTHGLWSSWERINDGGFRVIFEDEDDTDLSDDVSEPFVVTVEGMFNGVVHRISNRVVPTATSSRITVMFVTGNAYHADEDLERIAVIESWGYTVLTVTDSDGQSVYDAAAAQADVIYVSEESASGSVSTKLNGYNIGVVNEEQALQDELGMATSGGTWTGSTIDIIDNTHPITAGFALGDLQITANSTGLIQSGGTPASGLTTLAERQSSSTAVLTVLDVGDTMTDGNPSPQRRVTLPFGSNAFEYGQLNDDGQKLMKQAIDWAAASPAVSLVSPISRWTLDETVGTLAADSVGGHDGTYSSGGVTLGQPGQIDYAADFNGTTGYIEVPHDDDYLVNEGAITFWVYLDDVSGRQELFSKDSSGYDTGGHITIGANGGDVELRFQDTSTSYSLDSGSILSASTWHHVAFTFGPGGMRLYVDGTLVDSNTYTGGMGTNSGGAGNYEPIALGANTWTSGNLTIQSLSNYFNGRLDDVRFYDEQLSAEQAAALFESGEASETTEEQESTTPELVVQYDFVEPDPVTPDLVGHWQLDEGPAPGQLITGGRVWMRDDAVLDAYDSSVGTYAATVNARAKLISNSASTSMIQLSGSASVQGDVLVGQGADPRNVIQLGSSATITGAQKGLLSAATISVPSAPTGMAISSSHQLDQGGVTRTISADVRYGQWTVMHESQITISGDVTIVVDGVATFDRGDVIIPDGSSLTLYVGGNLYVNNDFSLNGEEDAADRLKVYLPTDASGSHLAYLRGSSVTAGTIYAGDDLSVQDTAVFYGAMAVADSIVLENDGEVHTDQALGFEGGVVFAEDQALGNDGTYIGGAAGSEVGIGDGGTAANFDGINDYIEVPHNPAYLLDTGTLSFWFRPSDITGTQGMVSKDTTNYETGGHIRVYLTGSQIQCRLQSTSTSYTVTSASGVVSANTWHHVAVGFGAGGLRMYLNGVLVDSDSYTGGLGTSSGGVGNEEPMLFGADLWQSSSGTTSGWNLPYHGRLDDIRLYDQNLDPDQAADLYAKTDPRDANPSVVYDTSENTPALDLAIADPENVTWINGGGLTINTATTITSGGPVERLHTAITASDAFTVEAVFTPANLTQNGPARIVSYSNGTANRNFTVGQEVAGYELRLRTEFNSSGLPAAISNDVLVVGSQEHLLVTYDPVNEELRTYRNGTLELTETWTGDLDNWNDGYELLLANEASDNRPWLGTLHRVAIYDGTFNSIQADNVFNGNPPGDGTGGDEGLAYQVEWLESP